MKIDVNYKFKNFNEEVVTEQSSNLSVEKVLSIKNWEELEAFKDGLKKGKPFTLKSICANVLLAPATDKEGNPKEMSGEEKCKRYDLAMRIYKSTGLVDLEVEEVALLKKLIAKSYPTITVGQAWKILDPHDAVEREKEPEKEPKPKDTPQGKSEKEN